MRTLHDALEELAADAPRSTAPAGELWERGRRWQRRRRAGTAVIAAAAAVVLVALASVTWVRLPDPAPMPADAPIGLPDRLYDPSPWLPGTDEEGPLGRLAVIVPADRGEWFGGDTGLVGVSAVTGEYRFLDLPDAVDLMDLTHSALSPDGRRVAYWTVGRPAGSPQADSPSVTGIAVYDVETEEVRRHDVPTEHGLAPRLLRWADADTLVLGYGHWRGGRGDSLMSQSSSTVAQTRVWDLAEPEPQKLPGPDRGNVFWAGPGHLLVGTRVVSLADGAVVRRVRIDVATSAEPILDSSLRRVAVVAGPRNPNAVLAGAVPASGEPVRLRRVPGSDGTFEVVAWVDEHRVAVRRRVRPGGAATALELLDVRDGSSVRATAGPGVQFGVGQRIARDLFAEPTVPGIEPPRPLDPRLVAGGVTATVLVAGVALLWWRRRVRP